MMTSNHTFAFGPGVKGLSAEDAARRSDRRFVRSEAGLAVYDPSRNPAGHVLTAWEAYTSFGIEALEEAVEWGSAILKETVDATQTVLKGRIEYLGLSHRSVAMAAKVNESDVRIAETNPSKSAIQKLERIAFTLGLDERFLAFRQDSGGDEKLTYRLRTLQSDQLGASGTISPETALLFAESASVIRAQHRLQKWLRLQIGRERFSPRTDYGSRGRPAWQVGYSLALDARMNLSLGNSPIPSMRNLVEERLGIPVVQTRLPKWISGATITTTDAGGEENRGVVLNTIGANQNVWTRRATLAHELGHLLYDPDEQLKNLLVDSYEESRRDAQAQSVDYVEQRANAFAIAFLAPNDAVQGLAPTPVSEESVSDVMHTFGISHTAARYHVANCHYRNFDVPYGVINSAPSDEWRAAEDFALDYFPLHDTPDQRKGRFAGLVAEAWHQGIISEDTVALYLNCPIKRFRENADNLRSLYDVPGNSNVR